VNLETFVVFRFRISLKYYLIKYISWTKAIVRCETFGKIQGDTNFGNFILIA
jgi:hypothetical protein